MLRISSYKSEQFSILESWFKSYEWEPCTQGSIGKNAFFVYNDDKPVAFSYFVATDTNIAHLGFILADKDAGMRERNEGLNMLLEHVFATAKEAGFEFMLYSTNTEAIVKRLKKLDLMQVVNSTYGYKLIGSLNALPIDFFLE